MNFMHYDLGRLPKGIFVEVTLRGNIANVRRLNVRLLDEESYQNYKDGDAYYYIGGLVHSSPVYLMVPQAGPWHLAVDVPDGAAVKSTVRLLRSSPATMQNLMNRIMYNNGREIKEVYNRTVPLKNKYDIFISFVTEDRGDIARPLAHYLSQNSVQAGFEEFEIKNDEGPLESLDKGLSNCHYGIFIVSKNMLYKQWKPYEWESAAAKITGGGKPIFPIWHNVTEQEISAYSRILALKPARSTARSTIESIAEEIAKFIKT